MSTPSTTESRPRTLVIGAYVVAVALLASGVIPLIGVIAGALGVGHNHGDPLLPAAYFLVCFGISAPLLRALRSRENGLNDLRRFLFLGGTGLIILSALIVYSAVGILAGGHS